MRHSLSRFTAAAVLTPASVLAMAAPALAQGAGPVVCTNAFGLTVKVDRHPYFFALEIGGVQGEAPPLGFREPVTPVNASPYYEHVRSVWHWSGVSFYHTAVFVPEGRSLAVWFADGNHYAPAHAVAGLVRGDFNLDGVVNSVDLSAFITRWVAGAGECCRCGDFDNNLVVDSADIGAFVAAWLEGIG